MRAGSSWSAAPRPRSRLRGVGRWPRASVFDGSGRVSPAGELLGLFGRGRGKGGEGSKKTASNIGAIAWTAPIRTGRLRTRWKARRTLGGSVAALGVEGGLGLAGHFGHKVALGQVGEACFGSLDDGWNVMGEIGEHYQGGCGHRPSRRKQPKIYG